MLRRFFLTLFSSWVATPLGVLIAHWVGVANEPLVLLILLGMGTAAPFQIFLNECIAVARSRFAVEQEQAWRAFIVTAQVMTGICATQALPNRSNLNLLDLLPVATLLGASTVLSYATAVLYYRQVIAGTISSTEAIHLGAIPGAGTLVIFASFAAVAVIHPLSPYWLLAIAIAPTAWQWLYTASRRNPPDAGALQTVRFPVFRTCTALMLLVALSFAGTSLRDKVAGADSQFTAFILVGLNTLISLLTTLTRVFHLDQTKPKMQPVLWVATASLAILSTLIGRVSELGCFLTALFAVQCGIVAVVNAGRGMTRTMDALSTSASQGKKQDSGKP